MGASAGAGAGGGGAGLGGAAIIGGSMLLSSLLNRPKKVEQQPLETEEQRAARRDLMRFADTGRFGDFQAGEELDLRYGDFAATDLENQGQSALASLLSSGIPEQYRLGDETLADLLKPQNIEASFAPFKALTERRMRESGDALKRNAAAVGNLYSTDYVRQLGDLEARGTETMTAELARLADQANERRLRAVPLAYQSAQAQEGDRLSRIAASQQYGRLTRDLNNARIQARDQEILRRREELKLPIQAATAVAGGNANFGVPSVTTSPYQELLQLAGQLGGQYLGNEMYMRQYKKHFPVKPTV